MSGGAKLPMGSAKPGGELGAVMPLTGRQTAMKTNRAGHLAMPSPVMNQRSESPVDQATRAARRRRCSIIASTPATRERALEPVAGSISGTGATTVP